MWTYALDLPEKFALLGLLNLEAELIIVRKTVSALLATCKGKGKGIINFTLDGRIYVRVQLSPSPANALV